VAQVLIFCLRDAAVLSQSVEVEQWEQDLEKKSIDVFF
jgi:hypothetical protein